MITRRIKIPLEHGREIVIVYKQQEDGSWIQLMSDECMQDLITFFNNGFYQLDIKKVFRIEDTEE